MTDRYSAFVVVLDHDIRDDDARHIKNALKMVKGVVDVKPHVAGNMGEVIAQSRASAAWIEALVDLIKAGPPAKGHL